MTGRIGPVELYHFDSKSWPYSIFEHLLHTADPATLVAEPAGDNMHPRMLRISGAFVCGTAEVVIDPERDYCPVRMVLDFGSPPALPMVLGMNYNIHEIRLTQVEGKWVPTGFSMTHTTEIAPDQDVPGGLEVATCTLDLSDVRFVSASEPDELFEMQWPPGIRILDHILDTTYIAGRSSPRDLENMVAAIQREMDRREMDAPAEGRPTGTATIDRATQTGGDASHPTCSAGRAAHGTGTLLTGVGLAGLVCVAAATVLLRLRGRTQRNVTRHPTV